MLRKSLFIMLVMLLGGVGITSAQDDTTTTPTSNVTIFVVICENQAVLNLSGTMQAGYDIYYQLFAGSQGTGEQLSNLVRVEVDGDYSVSSVTLYPEGKTIATSGIGSAYVTMSREVAPDRSIFSEYVDDIQDGCNTPQFALTDATDTETTVEDEGDATSGTITDVEWDPGYAVQAPFGGVMNPNYMPIAPQSDAKEDPNWIPPRQETAGLVFAGCYGNPMAEPGLIYDTDEVTVFWSWYAKTEQQVLDHMENVNYVVYNFGRVPLPAVYTSEIEYRNGDYWVFYYAPLGHLHPGGYSISLYATWDQVITDGYDDFGPGTANENLDTFCSFFVQPNPDGVPVAYSSWP